MARRVKFPGDVDYVHYGWEGEEPTVYYEDAFALDPEPRDDRDYFERQVDASFRRGARGLKQKCRRVMEVASTMLEPRAMVSKKSTKAALTAYQHAFSGKCTKAEKLLRKAARVGMRGGDGIAPPTGPRHR